MWIEVNGACAEIDECDHHLIAGRGVYIDRNGYVMVTSRAGDRHKGNYKGLHRLIMGLPRGMCVHHRDGNRLNNRRMNLQVISNQDHGWLHHGKNAATRQRERFLKSILKSSLEAA